MKKFIREKFWANRNNKNDKNQYKSEHHNRNDSEYKSEHDAPPHDLIVPIRSISPIQSIEPNELFLFIHSVIDESIFSNILRFLSPNEIDTLTPVLTQITGGIFFKHSIKPCHRSWTQQLFMKQVSRGDEAKVISILTHSNTKNLRLSTDFTEHTNKCYFPNIKPLQHAIFNLDSPMRDILIQYMSESEIKKQLQEIEDYGIDYIIPFQDFKRLVSIVPHIIPPLKKPLNPQSICSVTLNEKRLDWTTQILQFALQTFIDAVTTMEQTHFDWDTLETLWANVGFAQQYVTTPIINLYCSRFSLHPIPDFNQTVLQRTSVFEIYHNGEWLERDWHEHFEADVLERSSGIWRSTRAAGACRFCGGAGAGPRAGRAEFNLAVLTAFIETRISDNRNFKESVLGASHLNHRRLQW